jgi:hypothetical protein
LASRNLRQMRRSKVAVEAAADANLTTLLRDRL